MPTASPPDNEPRRPQAPWLLDVLDSGPDAEFDALLQAASLACGVPIALISLVDADRQWFQASTGWPGQAEVRHEVAFCAQVVRGTELLEVPDASADERFRDSPMVRCEPYIRFYAGAPMLLGDGRCVGTLCVIDHQPRQLEPAQREILRHLARAAVQALEGRHAARELQRAEGFLERTGRVAGVGGWEYDLRAQ